VPETISELSVLESADMLAPLGLKRITIRMV
jgi:hypothetical protein